jgi:hypothetical protein
MKGRRLAALLCVLLMHALAIFFLWKVRPTDRLAHPGAEFDGAPIQFDVPVLVEEKLNLAPPVLSSSPYSLRDPGAELAAGDGGTDPIAATADVDWPLEGKKAAARVLAREAEAARIAKLFAGPGGTWASLTKRQKSRLNKFRFRPGIDGLEYDSRGNQIYHISDGCVIVNSMFFACTVGKPKVHDDMFDNMREYFDEQRLPPTPEGNGTEPEALRPPY